MSFHDNLEKMIAVFLQSLADTNGWTVRYDNDSRTTPTSGLWLLAGLDLGESKQSELGLDRFRNASNYTIQVKNTMGDGIANILSVVDILVDAFESKNLNEVTFGVPRVVNVGRMEDLYQINVICPFFADYKD